MPHRDNLLNQANHIKTFVCLVTVLAQILQKHWRISTWPESLFEADVGRTASLCFSGTETVQANYTKDRQEASHDLDLARIDL